MNRRFTLPLMLIFLLGILVFTPVSAYTLDNGVCEGTENITHAFDFDTTGDVSFDEFAVLLYNETVDNTYHGDINGTAFRFAGEGTYENGITFVYHGLDISTNLTIDSVYLDLFNFTFNGLEYSDLILYWVNETEDIQYARVYYPAFNLYDYSGDYANVKYITNDDSYCWTWNITGGYEIENWETDCPFEINEIDSFQMNFPYGFAQGFDYSFDFAVDNMKFSHEENEFTTIDCVISYETIDDIPEYTLPIIVKHWVNFEALNPSASSEAWLNTAQLHFSVLPDYMFDLYYSNGLDRIIIAGTNLYEQWYLNGVNGTHHINSVLNITTLCNSITSQTPSYMYCINTIENGYREATEQELQNIEDSYTILNDFEVVSDTLGILKLEDYTIASLSYRLKLNDTYWKLGDSVRHKSYYCDLGYSDCDHVNLTWAEISNFTYSRIYISSPTSLNAENIGWTNRLEVIGDTETLVDNEGNDIILKGYALKNVNDSWLGNYLTQIPYAYGYDDVNIIGNGICEDMESYIPTDWNYDEQCEIDRYGGLTGYAVVNNSRSLMLIAFVMLLAGIIVTGFLVKENFALLLLTIIIMIALVSVGIGFMYSLW